MIMAKTLNHLSVCLPYLITFSGALILTLVLTPIVREMNRHFGMVDKPDPRRINRVPIPRGGGVALFLGVLVSYSVFVLYANESFFHIANLGSAVYWKLVTLAFGIVVLGYADDKFSLPAKVKLLGQLVIAFLSWYWVEIGFADVFPGLPKWADCAFTMFWICGAVNAFNLIDGLDGLASGIALIATFGMAGTLIIASHPQTTIFHFAFIGGLLGFLRYNYNPASVFLGDSGSMYIGFTLATLPLVSQTQNSFLVSVGVPILAMGVPIFDSSLAIIRRTIRRLIFKKSSESVGNDRVMTADSDHLHHRILRSSGLSQRKAAWILYLATFVAVLIGIVASSLSSKSSGLWLFTITLGSIVIFKNMARIELYDAGRFLALAAHDKSRRERRKLARLTIPLYLFFDMTIIVGSFLIITALGMPHKSEITFRVDFLVRISSTLLMFVAFGIYKVVWARAMLSNFLKLAIASLLSAVLGSIVMSIAFDVGFVTLVSVTIGYAILPFIGFLLVRVFRYIVRDTFYALDCSQMKARKDVTRVLVYGAGLRYRTFRRELVRRATKNSRIIVGLIDDDLLLHGQFIGGQRIEGTLQDAPNVINRLNVDEVIIACVVTDEWLKVIKEILSPTGVKITCFDFVETSL